MRRGIKRSNPVLNHALSAFKSGLQRNLVDQGEGHVYRLLIRDMKSSQIFIVIKITYGILIIHTQIIIAI